MSGVSVSSQQAFTMEMIYEFTDVSVWISLRSDSCGVYSATNIYNDFLELYLCHYRYSDRP